jgi:soluble lytic murein transglycosylase-like protein
MRLRRMLRGQSRTLVFFALASACSAFGQEASSRALIVGCASRYARIYQVPFELVAAIIHAESNWNPQAISRKGAAGLMQLMPDTARRFGVTNRFDVDQNIRGGVAYLAWLIRLFRGDFRLAVAAYQVGEAPILMQGLSYSSPRVFEYVSRVAQLFRAYRALSLGGRTRVIPYADSRGQR